MGLISMAVLGFGVSLGEFSTPWEGPAKYHVGLSDQESAPPDQERPQLHTCIDAPCPDLSSDAGKKRWVCNVPDIYASPGRQERPPFVLETDPETLLNLETVAGALGKDLSDTPGLNCTLMPTDRDLSDKNLSGANTPEIECSTSGTNPITGFTVFSDHNSFLSFSPTDGSVTIRHEYIFAWRESFQCSEVNRMDGFGE